MGDHEGELVHCTLECMAFIGCPCDGCTVYVRVETMWDICTAYVKSREKQLEKDRTQKQSAQYKLRRTASKRTTTDNPQRYYGPNSQQPDPSKEKLDHLCTDYYSREVVTCTEDAAYVETHTRQQLEDSLWFQQRL